MTEKLEPGKKLRAKVEAGRDITKRLKNYVVTIGGYIGKDLKKLGSNVSRAVRSKIEVNIILPKEKQKDEDH